MKKQIPVVAAGIAASLALSGGGTAFALTKDVTLVVDGQSHSVKTFGGDVSDALAKSGVKVETGAAIYPGKGAQVEDGQQITVNNPRVVSATVDGVATTFSSTALTYDDALAEQGIDTDTSTFSKDPALELGTDVNTIVVNTLKQITVKTVDGEQKVETTDQTVGDLMDSGKVKGVDGDDIVDADADTRLVNDAVLSVQRVEYKERTETQSIDHETKTEDDDSLAKGEKKVETEGKDGSKDIVVRQKFVNGELQGEEKVSEKVTEEPVTEVVKKGTKEVAQSEDSSSANSGSSDDSDSGSSDSTPVTGGTTCTASFYDEGQMTASGEQFDPSAMTAAHKTLPLGSKIRVMNPSTGQSVVVRINDRGPYVGGRCLDLSAAAFGAIGNTGSGTMTVTYEVIG